MDGLKERAKNENNTADTDDLTNWYQVALYEGVTVTMREGAMLKHGRS